MTDQQTSVEPRTTADEATDTPSQTPTGDPPAAERPMGTRELRDAQQGRTEQRPALRATGGDPGVGSASETPANAPLFDERAGNELRERWLAVQTEFVDEPRAAVQKADALVAEVLKQLTETFAREREALEAGWSGPTGSSEQEVSTEDLRLAIQRYRSFFNRLLAL